MGPRVASDPQGCNSDLGACCGCRLPGRRLAVITNSQSAPSSSVGTPVVAPAASKDLFSGLLARHTGRRRVIAMAEYQRPGISDQVDFYIAERKPGAVLRPYHMGDAPAITVRAGTTEKSAAFLRSGLREAGFVADVGGNGHEGVHKALHHVTTC